MTIVINGTTGISGVDGSAGTPAVQGTDTNTGVFFPAADTIAFTTGGTEDMRIDSSGNVGIGTSSPTNKLSVNGNVPSACAASFVSASSGSIAAGFSDNINSSLYIRPAGGGTVIGTDGANAIRFATNGNATTDEKMRIDSSGNVGIGTSSPGAKLDVTGNVRLSAGSPNIELNSGGPMVYVPAGNTLAFATGGGPASPVERMRIDSNGNVGIGTTSPQVRADIVSADSSNYDLSISGGRNASYTGSILFKNSYWSAGAYGAAAIRGLDSGSSGGLLAFYTTTNGGGTTGVPTERARIDNNGNLLINTTSMPSGYSKLAFVCNGDGSTWQNLGATGGAAPVTLAFLNSSGTRVGYIAQSGTATAFTSTSDYRLKENVQPMTGALAKVAQLKPCTYTWKSTGGAGQGFIAHELQAIVPDCVLGEKDEVDAEGNPKYQGVDTSFLVATLTAAIQEQQALITALTARIGTLETQSVDNPPQGETP